ncbi:MAG: hypothetical protein ACSHX6_09910 [Akkermansiaceae bacterium]
MQSTSEHISEQQGVVAPVKPDKPEGEVMLPALICGAVGAVLTIILSVIDRYEGVGLALKEYYMGEPFYMAESSGWHVAWDWVLVLLFTFGISFAVLDTDKKWRRVMMILLLSAVVILSSPVLMLWDVFWSPMTVFVGVLWSWICAFIYSCQHRMPCEMLVPMKVKVVKPEAEDIDISPLVVTEEQRELEADKYQPKD